MEELTAALASSFEVSSEPNKTSAPHPRYAQYKQRDSKSNQEARRKQLLAVQKSRRLDFMNLVRNLTDNDWSKEEENEEESIEQDESNMEVQTEFKKPGRYYKDQLMYSEWLVEVPNDFATEWLTVLCPVAKRCLVVASRGVTRSYSKSGYTINSFPSYLPGGCRRSQNRDSTILDCLYSEKTKTYYILDLMCWNGHAVYESETEFRFYWLHEKLRETPALGQPSKVNPYMFVGLPSFRCTQEDISSAVDTASFEIDGILFFHKRTHYNFGSTPLVVWLKPYMLEEILGITVADHQKTHMPEGYTNYADHMKKVEEDKARQIKERDERRKSGESPRGRWRGRGRGRGRGHRSNHCNSDGMEVNVEGGVVDENSKVSDISSEMDASDVSEGAQPSPSVSATGLGV